MREIKYRAWDGHEIFNVDVLAIGACTWDCPDYGKRGVSLAYQSFIKVTEYTGLNDKNGKEIYEGDIVDSWAGPDVIGTYLREVVRAEGEPKLEFNPSSGNILCKKNEYLFEIIGNIYEDRGLLNDCQTPKAD